MNRSLAIRITDSSGVGESRRVAAELARTLGLNATQIGEVSLVVTEVVTNIVKHARQGELILRQLFPPEPAGLEILSLDKGPGMHDVSRCLQDGYSTAGSPGNGLGAIARISTVCEIYSQPQQGTALLAQIWSGAKRHQTCPFELGAVCVAKDYQSECGDAWMAAAAAPDVLKLLLADGLGHGPLAQTAAQEAVRVFRDRLQEHPTEILQQSHGPLRPTRGAGISVAEIIPHDRRVRYAGVGNIAGAVVDGTSTWRVVSMNGTVGHALYEVREFSYPWAPSAVLVLHTDGLGSRWHLETYPGLIRHHPALIAGVLYRDGKRGNDDVTVVVARGRR